MRLTDLVDFIFINLIFSSTFVSGPSVGPVFKGVKQFALFAWGLC